MITEEQQLEEMRQEILEDKSNTSEDETFKRMLKKAKNRYLNLVYPFDRTITELPDDRARNWQTDCAIELYNLDGDENLTSYSENGLSESYGKAGLSDGLLSQLPPAKAGVPEWEENGERKTCI